MGDFVVFDIYNIIVGFPAWAGILLIVLGLFILFFGPLSEIVLAALGRFIPGFHALRVIEINIQLPDSLLARILGGTLIITGIFHTVLEILILLGLLTPVS